MGLIRDTILVGAATFVAGAGLMEIGDESNESLKSKVLPYIGTFLAGGLGYYFLRETNLVKASEYQPDQEFEDYSTSEIAKSSAIQGFQPFKYSVVGNRAEDWFYDVSFEAETITPPKPPLNVRWNEPKTDEEKAMCNPTTMLTNLLTVYYTSRYKGTENEADIPKFVEKKLNEILTSKNNKLAVNSGRLSDTISTKFNSRGNEPCKITSEGIFEYDEVRWALFKLEDWPYYKRRGYGPKLQDTYFAIRYERDGSINYRKLNYLTDSYDGRKRKTETNYVRDQMNAMYKPRYVLDPSEVMLEQMGVLESPPLLSPFRLKIKNKRRGYDPSYTHRYSIFGGTKEGSMTELFRWEVTNDSSKQIKPAAIMENGSMRISPGMGKVWAADFKVYQRLALLDPANFTMRRINAFNESMEDFKKVQDPLLLAVVTEQGGMIPDISRLSRYNYNTYKPPYNLFRNAYTKKQFTEFVEEHESDEDEKDISIYNEEIITTMFDGSRYYNLNSRQRMEFFTKGVKTQSDFQEGIVKDLFFNQPDAYESAYELGGLLSKNKNSLAQSYRLLLKRKTALLKEQSGDSGKA